MTRARTNADQAHTEVESLPHIIPGVLYPAVAGKLLDGSTSHSGDYGTAQSDGRSYFYTDIKGSKPIKDPRIGAYFGSQRHKFKSLQILEQETAMEGKNIFSVDGREWIRAYSTGGGWNEVNDAGGTYIRADSDAAGCFLEITGYFNDINFMFYCWDNRVDDIDISVNGTLSVDGSTTLGGDTSVETPLKSRYVDASSVINGGSTLSSSLGTTPKINTIRYEAKTGSSEYIAIMGIELIAQDTTSTANRSKIQIPAQTVVSYGKKHSISATAQHYDPFNGFTNSSDLHSAYVDTATSLGLDTAPGSSAKWAITGSNNIRPYNGGRVVKWIASDGTIKTSVNMMPPNAQNIAENVLGTTEVTTPSATNATVTPIFSDDPIDHSQSEIAKTFNFREFGNGSANQGAGGTLADFSTLNSADDISYVMDDGLTSLTGDDVEVESSTDLMTNTSGQKIYITFIGTGISVENKQSTARNVTWCKNLPYGTHIIGIERATAPNIDIDGIAMDGNASVNNHGYITEMTFHQPKMPPIPQDAVIIADYMLMADYVKSTNTTERVDDLSKGVRLLAASRDIHYDRSGGSWDTVNSGSFITTMLTPPTVAGGNATSLTAKLPYFGFTKGALFARRSTDATDLAVTATNSSGAIESTNVTVSTRVIPALSANIADCSHSGNVYGFFNWEKSDGVLGSNTVSFDDANLTGTFDWMYLSAMEIATPIHTSSHYQTFEGPFTKDLIGGDRNMEQTNLVVSPSGQTWDEVTRDTSYLGKGMCITTTWEDGTSYTSSAQTIAWDQWRGKTGAGAASVLDCVQKDWAISYNTVTCLVDGYYRVELTVYMHNASGGKVWYLINKIWDGSNDGWGHDHKSQNQSQDEANINVQYFRFKRGDYLSLYFEGSGAIDNYNQNILRIIRVS